MESIIIVFFIWFMLILAGSAVSYLPGIIRERKILAEEEAAKLKEKREKNFNKMIKY